MSRVKEDLRQTWDILQLMIEEKPQGRDENQSEQEYLLSLQQQLRQNLTQLGMLAIQNGRKRTSPHMIDLNKDPIQVVADIDLLNMEEDPKLLEDGRINSVKVNVGHFLTPWQIDEIFSVERYRNDKVHWKYDPAIFPEDKQQLFTPPEPDEDIPLHTLTVQQTVFLVAYTAVVRNQLESSLKPAPAA